MYLPLAAVMVVLVFGGYAALNRLHISASALHRCRLVGAAMGGAAVVALGVLTWARNQAYSNEVVLCEDTCLEAPLNPRAHMSLGCVYLHQQRFNEALAQFQEARRLRGSTWSELCNNLGLTYDGLSSFGAAAEQYQMAIELNPDFAMGYNNLAVALSRLGRNDEVPELFFKAAGLSPSNPIPHNNLADCLVRMGRLPEAADEYKTSLAIKPADPQILDRLADVCVRMGCEKEAEARWRETILLNPDFAAAHLKLGALLNQSERPTEAFVHLRRAVALAPQSARAHLNLAVAYRILGQTEQAQSELGLAERLAPSEPFLLRALEHERRNLPHAP